MTEKYTRWDAADDLKTEDDVAMYFEICVEEDQGDGRLIRGALGLKLGTHCRAAAI